MSNLPRLPTWPRCLLAGLLALVVACGRSDQAQPPQNLPDRPPVADSARPSETLPTLKNSPNIEVTLTAFVLNGDIFVVDGKKLKEIPNDGQIYTITFGYQVLVTSDGRVYMLNDVCANPDAIRCTSLITGELPIVDINSLDTFRNFIDDYQDIRYTGGLNENYLTEGFYDGIVFADNVAFVLSLGSPVGYLSQDAIIPNLSRIVVTRPDGRREVTDQVVFVPPGTNQMIAFRDDERTVNPDELPELEFVLVE